MDEEVPDGDVGCRGQTVQWHVDEKRVAAGGCGACGGVEAFPVGAAGIVDVHVGIDEAGENHSVGKIINRRVGRDLMGSYDVEDATVFYEQGGGTDGVWGDYTLRNEGAESHRRREEPRRARESRPERRRIAFSFQVSKIDKSRRKKCEAAVWRAYTCRLARAFEWFSGGIFR